MDARARTAAPAEPAVAAEWACALIEARQTILPKGLVEPGPNSAQLQQILGAAATARKRRRARPQPQDDVSVLEEES